MAYNMPSTLQTGAAYVPLRTTAGKGKAKVATRVQVGRKLYSPFADVCSYLLPKRRGLRRPHQRISAPASCAAATESPWFGVPPGEEFQPEYGTVPKEADKGRRAGVVLHPTSLPGPYGMGEIGEEAFKFIDWLASAHMQIWQVLPLVPPGRPIPGVREDYWSPYSGQDANAGNHLLISLQGLVDDGLLEKADLPAAGPAGDCDFDFVVDKKEPLLFKAAEALLAGAVPALLEEYQKFRGRADVAGWLDDAALFAAISGTPALLGQDWWEWPAELREREAGAMTACRADLAAPIDQYCALQFLFERQWQAVKEYANAKGVSVLGDMPIYVAGHSADVWAHRGLFTLGEDGRAELVSGVPPDAFSATGQLWGSPLYDWQAHAEEGFAWWKRRMGRALSLYDEVRIDHFRAMAGYWAVDAQAETAMDGVWKAGPGLPLFEALRASFDGALPIIAEDLGVITPDVHALRQDIQAPGMLVLQFAWGGGATNLHLPHNHYADSVVYPGTHDNDTAEGWFATAEPKVQAHFARYAGVDPSEASFKASRVMMQMGMASIAETCIICFQDVLGLDGSARMNTPATAAGNWAWRWNEGFADLATEAAQLRHMCKMFDRMPLAAKLKDPDEEGEEEEEE